MSRIASSDERTKPGIRNSDIECLDFERAHGVKRKTADREEPRNRILVACEGGFRLKMGFNNPKTLLDARRPMACAHGFAGLRIDFRRNRHIASGKLKSSLALFFSSTEAASSVFSPSVSSADISTHFASAPPRPDPALPSAIASLAFSARSHVSVFCLASSVGSYATILFSFARNPVSHASRSDCSCVCDE